MATVIRGGRWADPATGQQLPDDNESQPTADCENVKKILALVLQRSHIGIAVYHEEDSVLLWSQ